MGNRIDGMKRNRVISMIGTDFPTRDINKSVFWKRLIELSELTTESTSSL